MKQDITAARTPEQMGRKIDGPYIKTGTIASADGAVQINLSGKKGVVFNSGVSTNGIVLRGDSVNAKELVKAEAHRIKGKDTIAIVFYSSDKRGLGALSNTFDGEDQVGLQFRAFNVDQEGNRNCGISIVTLPGEAGYLLVDGEEKTVGYFNTNGSKSELGVNEADIGVINGKRVSWKDNGDGTFSLIGEEVN